MQRMMAASMTSGWGLFSRANYVVETAIIRQPTPILAPLRPFLLAQRLRTLVCTRLAK